MRDVVACFGKTGRHVWNPQFEPYEQEFVEQYYRYDDGDGRLYWRDNIQSPNPRPNLTYEWKGYPPPPNGWRYSRERMTELDAQGRIYYPAKKTQRPMLKRYLDEAKGMPVGDTWTDVKRINQMAKERVGYDTQKPEVLLERIIRSSSDEGSIVLDCFVGSGTTAAVAERLGRRWIAVDIGRFAVHTTRKRLLDIPDCKPFVVANLGHYERQVWQQATTGEEVSAYLDFIVELYGAAPLESYVQLHGTLGPRAVHVGSVDAAVSLQEIRDALAEARSASYPALDVLGWEFDMGLHELVQDEARAAGVDLRLRRIPREVMDPRVVASGEYVFHELAYVKVATTIRKRSIAVTLEDFVLPNPDLVPPSVRGKVKGWSDYVDYWAVDFTYGTGEHGDTFHNQWQSYRTRAERRLELTASHEYDEPGQHVVLVKVVDIFGNDTTTAVPVTVR